MCKPSSGRRCLKSLARCSMSYPVASNLQYRLSEVDGGTLIKFRHNAFGLIQEEHKRGVTKGWGGLHERVRTRAEAPGSRAN